MAVFSEQVLTQLYEDAPFWWYLKSQAIRSPLYKKEQIAELEDRLYAFLDMLLLADKDNHQPLEKFLWMNLAVYLFILGLALNCNNLKFGKLLLKT